MTDSSTDDTGRRPVPPAHHASDTSNPRPDFEGGGGQAPETGVRESDPNADSAAGLTGEMGVSSERVGVLRGDDDQGATGAMDTFEPLPEGKLPPEQAYDPDYVEVNPDPPVRKDHGHVSGM